MGKKSKPKKKEPEVLLPPVLPILNKDFSFDLEKLPKLSDPEVAAYEKKLLENLKANLKDGMMIGSIPIYFEPGGLIGLNFDYEKPDPKESFFKSMKDFYGPIVKPPGVPMHFHEEDMSLSEMLKKFHPAGNSPVELQLKGGKSIQLAVTAQQLQRSPQLVALLKAVMADFNQPNNAAPNSHGHTLAVYDQFWNHMKTVAEWPEDQREKNRELCDQMTLYLLNGHVVIMTEQPLSDILLVNVLAKHGQI